MVNRIPENTSVEAKFAKFIYLKDIMLAFAIIMIAYFITLIGLVPDNMTAFFYIFCGFVLLVLIVRPFFTNPKRRQFSVFILTLKKDRNTYEEIPLSVVKKFKEEKNNGNVQNKRHYKKIYESR